MNRAKLDRLGQEGGGSNHLLLARGVGTTVHVQVYLAKNTGMNMRYLLER